MNNSKNATNYLCANCRQKRASPNKVYYNTPFCSEECYDTLPTGDPKWGFNWQFAPLNTPYNCSKCDTVVFNSTYIDRGKYLCKKCFDGNI